MPIYVIFIVIEYTVTCITYIHFCADMKLNIKKLFVIAIKNCITSSYIYYYIYNPVGIIVTVIIHSVTSLNMKPWILESSLYFTILKYSAKLYSMLVY
uniref:Uncharacterized protein n=1 Tax=Octopus bimaculoides TaxID=37653 RepID=A0A0L8IG82_OCTBM